MVEGSESQLQVLHSKCNDIKKSSDVNRNQGLMSFIFIKHINVQEQRVEWIYLRRASLKYSHIYLSPFIYPYILMYVKGKKMYFIFFTSRPFRVSLTTEINPLLSDCFIFAASKVPRPETGSSSLHNCATCWKRRVKRRKVNCRAGGDTK